MDKISALDIGFAVAIGDDLDKEAGFLGNVLKKLAPNRIPRRATANNLLKNLPMTVATKPGVNGRTMKELARLIKPGGSAGSLWSKFGPLMAKGSWKNKATAAAAASKMKKGIPVTGMMAGSGPARGALGAGPGRGLLGPKPAQNLLGARPRARGLLAP